MITVRRIGTRKGTGGYRLDADPNDCLEWDGNVNKNGYGRLWVEYPGGARKLKYAHRVAWEACFGEIPDKWEIDHLCVNTRCYLLDHLELVPPGENQARSNKRVTHCPRGHAYSQENTYITRAGLRTCRTCHRDRERERGRDSRRRDRDPVPIGLRRDPKWVDVLELVSMGYSISRISDVTGVSRGTIRKYFPGYRILGTREEGG